MARRPPRLAPREVTPGDVARAYQALAADENGQVVLADLSRRFGFSRRSTYVPGSTTPDDSVYFEGQRSVLVHIGFMQDVNADEYEQSRKQEGEQ